MARKAFLHINGVTYELAFEVDSEYDQAFHDVERRIGELTSGSGNQQTFSVLIDGQPAELRATTQGVFAAAAFLGKEPSAVKPVRRPR